MTETLEDTAQKIAEHGRDALVARLRPAFEQAAATHGDGLELDDEQLERMIQNAADRADGLQWRRALAQVATEQLGIGLGEALSHPAVARAQAILGAPSYEDALGELTSARPAAPSDKAPREAPETPAQPSEPEAEPDEAPETPAQPSEPEAEPDEALRAEDSEEPAIPEPVPARPATVAAAAAEPAFVAAAEPVGEPGAVRLRAVHLGGIANLAPAEGDLELHLSDAGLDIVRGPERSPLGRLTWDEIIALETPAVGGRFRRKKQADAHLVIRGAQGSASFEVPGVTSEELNEHIAPMLARHQK